MNGSKFEHIPFKGRETASGDWSIFASDQTQPEGAWSIQREGIGNLHMRMICPCGCRGVSILPLGTSADAGRHAWAWDGNEDAPTLSPSIYRRMQCGWHGFLRAGVWESC